VYFLYNIANFLNRRDKTMKKLFLLIMVLVSSMSFASESNLSAKIGSAWKNQPTIQPALDQHDLTMVYGGEDVVRRPAVGSHVLA
jgi:hypothetical protein